MYSNRLTIAALFFVSAFTGQGCIPEELPVPRHEPGDVMTATAAMERDYKWQIYYNLESNSVTGKVLKNSWDIGLEATADGYRVILNNAKGMLSYKTAKTDLSLTGMPDTAGVTGLRDSPTGNLDSTAIGDWRDGNVYILYRGTDKGTAAYRKIRIISSEPDTWTFTYDNPDGSDPRQVSLKKDDRYNFTFFSFDTDSEVMVEPQKTDWDIVFSTYTHIYYNLDNTPYQVQGCLLNRYNTSAAVDTIRNFAEISRAHTADYAYSTQINTIGFDWKAYSGGVYVIHSYKNYVIRKGNDVYYKLHFIDFLNETGETGYPKWEFQEL